MELFGQRQLRLCLRYHVARRRRKRHFGTSVLNGPGSNEVEPSFVLKCEPGPRMESAKNLDAPQRRE